MPAWTPGTRHGYHGFTLGWYEGELIRRTDPAERSLVQFFAAEIAKPLGLDFYIGLPVSVDRGRVAYLHAWPVAKLLLHLNMFPPRTFSGTAQSVQLDSAVPRDRQGHLGFRTL